MAKADLSFCFELNTSAKLSKEDQVQNDWSRQQGILARVVHHYGVLPTHEYLRCVLVHGPLAIRNIRHILKHHTPTIYMRTKHMHKLYLCIECERDGYLDDNHVIGMLTGLVKDSIARDHVVHHITF